ncbi:hypothetical protein CW706_00115 [Candidatus Bathyarchaeota archaeon]|nr:MAG: hypothetical protein CW706_00115 [Candidatus Bathyarchaeota archaeon]
MSKSRRLVYVSENLIREAMEVARSEGKSLGVFVEESIELALLAKRLGYRLKEAADLLAVTKANRILGGTFVPLNVFNFFIKVASKDKSRSLKERWYESGKLHGKYLKEKFEDPVEAFKEFLEASRWDLNEVEVKNEGDLIKLRCFSSVLTNEGTEALLKYVEGAFHGMGYETTRSDHMKGMIILDFKGLNVKNSP